VSTTFLCWVGGPHDGLQSAEQDLPLELGDAVRCACHDVAYEARVMKKGAWYVYYDDAVWQGNPARLVGAER
jgi:hypothetical protein